jgi:hypothetical protein
VRHDGGGNDHIKKNSKLWSCRTRGARDDAGHGVSPSLSRTPRVGPSAVEGQRRILAFTIGGRASTSRSATRGALDELGMTGSTFACGVTRAARAATPEFAIVLVSGISSATILTGGRGGGTIGWRAVRTERRPGGPGAMVSKSDRAQEARGACPPPDRPAPTTEPLSSAPEPPRLHRRSRFTSPRIELLARERAQRVRHDDRLERLHPQSGALDQGLVREHGGDDDGRRNPRFFQPDGVVRTARRAAASITDPGERDVVLGGDPRQQRVVGNR